jgi:dipeptidyl aminopeptidase
MDGNRLAWQGWQLSADMEYVLIKTDYIKVGMKRELCCTYTYNSSAMETFFLRQLRDCLSAPPVHNANPLQWIHRISDSTTHPLHTTSDPPTISYCTWSPVSHSIAYVSENDLYILPADQISTSSLKPIRVTDDGAPSIFNGVPDWVYEEEVSIAESILV